MLSPAHRIAILPLAALAVGLCVNAVHPRGVRWDGGAVAVQRADDGGLEALEPAVPMPSVPVMPEGVSTEQARAWMKQERVVVVDVRTPAAYTAGHISGAVSFPVSENVQESVPAFLRRFSKNTPLLLYCDSDACPKAMDLALALINARRFRDVRYLAGGYAEWLDSGADRGAR